MTAKTPPAVFDPTKVVELFTSAKLPMFDADALFVAQRKNLDAFVAASRTFFAGYQDLFKREMALIEAGLAEARATFADLQAQPLTADKAAAYFEDMRGAFEKAAADTQELAELAAKANEGAFAIVKARVEEALGEIKTAADKIAA